MIRTEKLTKDFGHGRGVFALDLSVQKGTIYGFVGHNGAGKTTAIKILCGLLRPDSGRAFIGDVEVCPKNLAKIKRSIGFMPDITGVYDQMSVWEFLDFYGAAFKIPPKERRVNIERVLELTHASDMIDYQVSSLSRGMRQKIGLAKTLVHDPDVLILDEPAGGLDPTARIEMRHTIAGLRSLGKTVLLSSHILPELASICDSVGIMDHGRLLAQGTVKEISEKLQENLSILVTIASDAAAAKGVLESIDQVSDVTIADSTHLSFTYLGGRDRAGTLLEELQSRGVKVCWFTENEAGLENVFINITSGQSKQVK